MTHPSFRTGAKDGFAHNRPRLALLWATIRHDEYLRAKALYRMAYLGWFRVLFGPYLMAALGLLFLILAAVVRNG